MYTWNWILLMVRSRDECKKDNHFVGLYIQGRSEKQTNEENWLKNVFFSLFFFVIRCFLIYIYWFRCILISVTSKQGGMNYWNREPHSCKLIYLYDQLQRPWWTQVALINAILIEIVLTVLWLIFLFLGIGILKMM